MEIGVLSGSLQRDVAFQLSFSDESATGKKRWSHSYSVEHWEGILALIKRLEYWVVSVMPYCTYMLVSISACWYLSVLVGICQCLLVSVSACWYLSVLVGICQCICHCLSVLTGGSRGCKGTPLFLPGFLGYLLSMLVNYNYIILPLY